MKDDLKKKKKMKDNYKKNGRQTKKKKNGRQPHKKMEDDLNKNENGSRPHFCLFKLEWRSQKKNGRRQ